MSQIQTQDGLRGIVMKIQDNGKSYVGMFDQIKDIKQFKIKQIKKTWKINSQQFINNQINNGNGKVKVKGGIFDVNQKRISETLKLNKTQENQQDNKQLQLTNGKKRRLKSTSLMLNTCYDLYYGDMISFIGCKGSKKTSNAFSMIKQFQSETYSKNQQNKQIQKLSIYVNPSFKQSAQLLSKNPNTLVFSNPHGKKPTDIGIYMLTLKAINLSMQLKNKGIDTLLIIDNLNDIMMRQWSLLQSIKFNSKSVDSSKLFQYNTLKISPISFLNQIYANCIDNKQQKIKVKKGSLTSVLISQKQNNQLMQQISHYSNNIKHLQTLSKVIEFPIDFKINTNNYTKNVKKNQDQSEINNLQDKNPVQLYSFMRKYANQYLQQKSQTELKRSLYKNQLKDAPWDYFLLLDSQWWIKDFKQMNNFQTYIQTCKFIKWIQYNIQNDLIAQWNINAKASFNKFIAYLKNRKNLNQLTKLNQIKITQQDIKQFLDEAKMEGLLSPFKKDYLI